LVFWTVNSEDSPATDAPVVGAGSEAMGAVAVRHATSAGASKNANEATETSERDFMSGSTRRRRRKFRGMIGGFLS
jgi:hypothetical protein